MRPQRDLNPPAAPGNTTNRNRYLARSRSVAGIPSSRSSTSYPSSYLPLGQQLPSQQYSIDDPRLPERFWAKVSPEPTTGCWLWFGSTSKLGYGHVSVAGKLRPSHRACYEALIGDVPPGLELDHVRDRGCSSRACVNPDHLEPVTHQVNCQRSSSGDVAASRMLAASHCPKGHPYDGDNLYLDPRGHRQCRECRREAKKSYRLNGGAAVAARWREQNIEKVRSYEKARAPRRRR